MIKKAIQFAKISLAIFALSCYTVFAQVKKHTNHPPPVRASFYAPRFEGRLMANGHRYHSNALTGASLKFPLGARVRVTNVKTGQSVVITITDRGPWRTRFALDLSEAAFKGLGFSIRQGWGLVTAERII